MDMHSADLVARADHLQIAHDPVMARRRRDALVQPVGAGMGARGHPKHAVLAGNGRDALAQVGQRGPRFTHLDARAGGDFKLALQHLALHFDRIFDTNGCNQVRRYIVDR